MADEETQDPALENTDGAGKKKKLIIIGEVIVVVLALLGAGVAYYFLAEDSDVVGEGDAPEPVVLDRPVYHELRPEFIITFDANNRQRYILLLYTSDAADE